MEENMVIAGVIVSATELNSVEVGVGFLIIENGKIIRKGNTKELLKLEKRGALRGYNVMRLERDQFVMPGFIDCHTHASQYQNLGLGLNCTLLDWMDKYSLPTERQFYKIDYAQKVYSQVVRRLLINGTTTACYYGSLHLNGTMELVKSIISQKQRALVGKVSTNIKNNFGYYNDIDTELAETKKFIRKVKALGNDLVQPIVSPRSPLSCDNEMMNRLATLAIKYDCPIQGNISESVDEMQEVLKLNPGCIDYAEVYDKCGVLSNKCILAHAVHLTEQEIELLKMRDVRIVHCPSSNTRLHSGICPVRKLINHGLKMGLGTSVAGGANVSMLDAIRRMIDVSAHLNLLDGHCRPVTWKEALYLATLGGAEVLNLQDKVGTLEVNKDFDALIIDVYAPGGPIDCYNSTFDTVKQYNEALVQRFLSAGDDRNLSKVYVKGRLIKHEGVVV